MRQIRHQIKLPVLQDKHIKRQSAGRTGQCIKTHIMKAYIFSRNAIIYTSTLWGWKFSNHPALPIFFWNTTWPWARGLGKWWCRNLSCAPVLALCLYIPTLPECLPRLKDYWLAQHYTRDPYTLPKSLLWGKQKGCFSKLLLAKGDCTLHSNKNTRNSTTLNPIRTSSRQSARLQVYAQQHCLQFYASSGHLKGKFALKTTEIRPLKV